LEALAEPGSICVSRVVRDQVRDKLDFLFEDLGEQQVKNIARPVRVYRVQINGAARVAAAPAARLRLPRWAIAIGVVACVVAASAAVVVWRLHLLKNPTAIAPVTPLALADKPSIAVLPFANLSGDPAQDYIAEGLTENLIDALAQDPGLLVVAHNATLLYRGKSIKPQEVAKDLSARYVLEGSVQKSGDQIRVTAQLIDATTDNRLLSRKYDRKFADLFVLEDDLTLQIASALDVHLSGRVEAQIIARGTRNLEAWVAAVKAFQAFELLTPAGMEDAVKLGEHAIELDPNYTFALLDLAYAYFLQANNGWAKDRASALGRARQLNDKALKIDPQFAPAYRLRAALDMLPDLPEFDFEAALADARKSVELQPNDDLNHWTLGSVFFWRGRFGDASAAFATALRLNPHPYSWEPGWHAMALSAAGHHEAAMAEIANPKNAFEFFIRGRVEAFAQSFADTAKSFERAHELDPDSAVYAFNLAAVYDKLGRVDEAISLLENGPPQWRSVPYVRLWLALSYALAGRKEQAVAEFAAFRALAPKYTLAIERQLNVGSLTQEFLNQIVALSGEYGIPEK
jgi:TolB-like protein/Flp pilus assembly protein TadD